MKLITGWMCSAGLVFTAAAANAQALAPYEMARSPYAVVSDIGGAYAAMPGDTTVPRYGPTLLPPQEVYTVVRESGFSPLGPPRQRGFVYTIAVTGRDDGQLVIDARTGRIIRFLPAYGRGGNFNDDVTASHGPATGMPPVRPGRASAQQTEAIPRVASRAPPVPMPKAAPPHADEAKPLASRPAAAPAQQSAAVQVKPAEAPATSPPAPAAPAAEAKPTQILPTQEMPKAQGLD